MLEQCGSESSIEVTTDEDDESYVPDRSTMIMNKHWILKRCDLFEKLTDDQAERLERNASLRNFPKGSIIYAPHDPGRSVLVLAEGRVKLKGITPDGKETIVAFIEEGELFGELAIVDDAPRDEFAESVVDSTVLAIACETLFELVDELPAFSFKVTRLLGLRRRRIETRLRNILFRSNRQRVAGILLELLEASRERTGEERRITPRLSHQEIAGLIGSTRETVTLVLGQLQLEGLIKVGRRSITIVDRHGLSLVTNS
jgi:CRP-like cAMP-binding protein